jgi:hypothetical protein
VAGHYAFNHISPLPENNTMSYRGCNVGLPLERDIPGVNDYENQPIIRYSSPARYARRNRFQVA